MHRVVLEHVAHVIDGDEGVVDANNRNVGVRLRRAHDEAADSAKSVNSYPDRHFCVPAWRRVRAVRVDGVSAEKPSRVWILAACYSVAAGASMELLFCEQPVQNLSR